MVYLFNWQLSETNSLFCTALGWQFLEQTSWDYPCIKPFCCFCCFNEGKLCSCSKASIGVLFSALKLSLMGVTPSCYSHCFHSGQKLGWIMGRKGLCLDSSKRIQMLHFEWSGMGRKKKENAGWGLQSPGNRNVWEQAFTGFHENILLAPQCRRIIIWNTGSCHGTELSPTDELYCLIMCQPKKSHSEWLRYFLWGQTKTIALSCDSLKRCNNKHLSSCHFLIHSVFPPKNEVNSSEEWKFTKKENKKYFLRVKYSVI